LPACRITPSRRAFQTLPPTEARVPSLRPLRPGADHVVNRPRPSQRVSSSPTKLLADRASTPTTLSAIPPRSPPSHHALRHPTTLSPPRTSAPTTSYGVGPLHMTQTSGLFRHLTGLYLYYSQCSTVGPQQIRVINATRNSKSNTHAVPAVIGVAPLGRTISPTGQVRKRESWGPMARYGPSIQMSIS
jgi:hypothetical protein